MNQHTIPTGSAAGPGRNITSILRANQKVGQEAIPEGPIDRFYLVNLIKQSGVMFPARNGQKWTPPIIRHLELLVSMTQERDWRDGKPIVWMSVQETARRLGVTTSVVNENEKALVKLGAAFFNDSGNYRRFGKRDERGRIVEAYGINLLPLLALKDYLEDMEKMVTEEWQEWKRAKSAYSAVRRYLGRLLVSEQANGVCLEGVKGEFEAIVACMKSRANTPLEDFQDWGAILGHFKVRLESMLDEPESSDQKPPAPVPVDNSQDSAKMLGKTRCAQGENTMPVSDKPDTHRILTTNTLKKDINDCNGAGAEPPPSTAAMTKECPEGGSSEVEAPPPKRNATGLRPIAKPIAPMMRRVMERQEECEDKASNDKAAAIRRGGGDLYVGNGATDKFNLERFVSGALPSSMRDQLPEKPDWDSVKTLARALASETGVSEALWKDACDAMGEALAAICMLIVAAKHEIGDVGWPGGYLKGMLRKHDDGELHLMPTIYGLDKKLRSEGE